MKIQSINQAVWRANVHAMNGTSPRWRHLEEIEIEQIRELRMRGNTLSYIAKKFNRSIRTIEKRTKDIKIDFVDFDKNMGKGGNTSNHNTVGHYWRTI